MKMIAALLLCILYFPYVSMEMMTADSSAPSSEFVETLEKRCPPGLWCGKKRGISKEQAMISDDEDQHTDVDAFEKRCPPGLWCGKKRAITEENVAEEEEKDESSSLEAFEKRCPPGLWWGKKRTISKMMNVLKN